MDRSISNRPAKACVVATLFAAVAAFSTSTASAALEPLDHDGAALLLDYEGSPVTTYLVIPDEENMHFSNATVDLREGVEVVMSAELTVVGTGIKDGTSNTMMIGLLAPGSDGFMDYTDDVALEGRRLASGETEVRACAAMRRAWTRYLDLLPRKKWEGPDFDANTSCIISPRDPASGFRR
jgi:hypothetical protein